MSKRHINKRQSARIKKIQAKFRDLSAKNQGLNKDGLVISRFGRHAEIEDTEGQRIHCSIRSNLDSLVAGDRVIWQLQEKGRGVIVSLYPRTSVLGRPDKRKTSKPVAANITQLMIVVAPIPEPNWVLLDSYLIMAEILQLQAIIVLNKIDLPCENIKQELLYYQNLGYPILLTSQKKLQTYECHNPEVSIGKETRHPKNKEISRYARQEVLLWERLKEALNNQTSVFVGQSGVGKSSLISGVLPHETAIETAEVSSTSQLGCHTTTNSRLFHLPSGGALIDSPGVREFSLWHMPLADILYGFRELHALVSLCKFRNCEHKNSPGCALVNACDEGLVSKRRYENFIKISKQLAFHYPKKDLLQ